LLNKQYTTYIRYILLTISILVCIFLYYLIYTKYNEKKAFLLEKLDNYNKILCRKNELNKEKELINRIERSLNKFYLMKFKNESEASIKFQEHMAALSDQLEPLIQRVEIPKIKTDPNGVKYITMTIHFYGNTSDLLRFLYNIKSSKNPRLIIDSLEFNKRTRYRKKQKTYFLRGRIKIKAILQSGDIFK